MRKGALREPATSVYERGSGPKDHLHLLVLLALLLELTGVLACGHCAVSLLIINIKRSVAKHTQASPNY